MRVIRAFACLLGMVLLAACSSTAVVEEQSSPASAAETHADPSPSPATATATATATAASSTRASAPAETVEAVETGTQPSPLADENDCSAPTLPDPWVPREAADLVDYANSGIAFSGDVQMWVLQTDQGWGGPAAIIVRNGEGARGAFSSLTPGGLTHTAHFWDQEARLVYMVAVQMESFEFEELVLSAEDLVNQGTADLGALSVVRSGTAFAPDFSVDVSYEANLRDGPKNRVLIYYCDSDASTTGGLWATDPMLYTMLILELQHDGDIQDLISVDLGGLPGLAFAQHETGAPEHVAIGMADGRALIVAINSGSLDDPVTSASLAAEFADLDLGPAD